MFGKVETIVVLTISFKVLDDLPDVLLVSVCVGLTGGPSNAGDVVQTGGDVLQALTQHRAGARPGQESGGRP